MRNRLTSRSRKLRRWAPSSWLSLVSSPAAGSSSSSSFGLAASALATPMSLRCPWTEIARDACRRGRQLQRFQRHVHLLGRGVRRLRRQTMSARNENHRGRSAATSRLSRTVRSSNSSSDWNVRTSPSLARASGRRPARSMPSKRTSPLVIGVKPVMASMNVVLPAPFGPISPTSLPASHVRSISSFGVQSAVRDGQAAGFEQCHVSSPLRESGVAATVPCGRWRRRRASLVRP